MRKPRRNHGGSKNGCVDLQDDVTKSQEEKYEETWISPGTASATTGKRSAPSNKNSRIRAVFKGLLDCWKMRI